MNIALIGYGRMGHEIEAIAVKRGHNVKLIIDVDNADQLNKANLKGIDVAIEFTFPEAAFGNISKCLKNGVPVVSGTTGWLDDYSRAVELCKENNTSFLHTTNFSIGVNLLFRLNTELAKLMNKYSDYSVSVEEIHHTKKLDAPSGTALSLVKGITENHSGYEGWSFADEVTGNKIPVTARREGLVPGTHYVKWDSEIDTIVLKHEAKNRKGLALGAVVAAEFVATRKGIFTMADVMGY
ncbi:MAG TPA: 4-hydroxy-tetrahydrodipicolinate reductase [Bacteroidales bacterium]|nr:4-hydroxy-tetrahydrodipicolinate reductase [Bacteroidales bacterium]